MSYEPLSLEAREGADTEQVALLPQGHARELLHSWATEALCAQPPPVPRPPPTEETEQLWRRISHAAHNTRQTRHTKAPRVAIWNVNRGGGVPVNEAAPPAWAAPLSGFDLQAALHLLGSPRRQLHR